MSISHKVQNAQSSSYPMFQIILCKTDIAPKGFFLVQSDLKWAFWAEKRGAGAMACQGEKAKYFYQSMPKSFLNI